MGGLVGFRVMLRELAEAHDCEFGELLRRRTELESEAASLRRVVSTITRGGTTDAELAAKQAETAVIGLGVASRLTVWLGKRVVVWFGRRAAR
jgi:hypothetical protein